MTRAHPNSASYISFMNIDPLIIVHDSKHVYLQKAVSSIEKFTSIVCNDNPASILSKQLRLSKPSDDVSEKLKVLVASINEEMGAYTAAMRDAATSNINETTKSSSLEEDGSASTFDNGAKKRKLRTSAGDSKPDTVSSKVVKVEKKTKVGKKSKPKT